MADVEPVLRAVGISKRFGAVRALQDVDLDVYPAEVVGLVGDNGAGKSTLIKCLAGTGPADAGEVWFEGRKVALTHPQDASDLGIATVYQDLALCDNLDVVANLFLGQEARRTRLLDETAMEGEANRLLASLAVTTLRDVRMPVASLSGGQRQSVAIARSLLGSPKLVILDEPTAALGVAQTAQVLELVRRLRARGLGVILISHNLENVFDIADRIVVLRLGRNVASFDVSNTTQEAVVGAITGAEFGTPPGPEVER